MSLLKLKASVANLFKRCKVAAVDNSSGVQTVDVQVYINDGSASVERLQQYGFSAHPDADGDLAGLVVSVNGQRFLLALDDPKYRPKDALPGEVDVWHKNGVRIRLKNDETAEVICKKFLVKASEKARFETPLLETTGTIKSDGDQIADGVSQIDHWHKAQGATSNTSKAKK